MDLANYVWLFVVICILGYLFLRRRRRAADIRALAARTGFVYIGSALPKSLSIDGTDLLPLASVWNVIDGEPRGIRVVAFDCQIGFGRGSWRRTVIAVQTRSEMFTAVGTNLIVERSGEWAILYQPKVISLITPGLMPVDELEAHLNAIS